MKYKALLIGCGQIGAIYDLHSSSIITHAKAWVNSAKVSLTVFDTNTKLAIQVSKKYNCDIVEEITLKILSDFDLVSLATPTSTHFEYIRMIIEARVSVIVCEKPISLKRKELDSLKDLYVRGSSKILVNYIRRYHPDFIRLKEIITQQNFASGVSQIIVKYNRGFLNNCSHAIDLLEYLFSEPFYFENTSVSRSFNDFFVDDPTITLTSKALKKELVCIGLTKIHYPVFEIEIFTKTSTIFISNKAIRYENKSKIVEDNVKVHRGIEIGNGGLINYMEHIISKAIELHENKSMEDGFLETLAMNKRLINLNRNE